MCMYPNSAAKGLEVWRGRVAILHFLSTLLFLKHHLKPINSRPFIVPKPQYHIKVHNKERDRLVMGFFK